MVGANNSEISVTFVFMKGANNSARLGEPCWSTCRIRKCARARLLTPSGALFFDTPLHSAASSFLSLSIPSADIISCSPPILLLLPLLMCFCSHCCRLSALLSGKICYCRLLYFMQPYCFDFLFGSCFIHYVSRSVACVLQYVCNIDPILIHITFYWNNAHVVQFYSTSILFVRYLGISDFFFFLVNENWESPPPSWLCGYFCVLICSYSFNSLRPKKPFHLWIV